MGFWEDLAVALRLRKRHANIVVVGLDNSGKSTVVHFLKRARHGRDADANVVPTVGFHVENIQCKLSSSFFPSSLFLFLPFYFCCFIYYSFYWYYPFHCYFYCFYIWCVLFILK